MLLALLLTALHITEGFVSQILLVAQCVLKALHGLLARAIALFTLLTLSHLHVFHHLHELIEKCLRLVHATLLHQLFDLIEKLLKLILRHGLCVRIRLRLLISVLTLLFRKLPHVIIHGLTQLLHQLGDLVLRRATPHGLVEHFLSTPQSFGGIRKVAFLELKCRLPEKVRQRIACVR